MATQTRTSGGSTAVVAIFAILAILALVWFFFLRGNAPVTGGGSTNVDVNLNPGEAVEVTR